MPWRRNRLLTRLNIILAVFFVLLVLVGSLLSYQRQRALILTFVRVSSRFLAGTAITEMGTLKPPFLNVPANQAPAYHSSIRMQGLAKTLTMRDKYRLRVVSLGKGSKFFSPTPEEAREMEMLRSKQAFEYDWVVMDKGERILSYMRALMIDATCLRCHGSYEDAPDYVRRLFPRDSPVYNRSEGEIVGAVSVTMPMRDVSEEVWINTWPDIAARFVLFLIFTLALRALIRREVLTPLSRLTSELCTASETGEMPTMDRDDEVSELIAAHDDLMEQMGRKVLMYRESEERYRTIVELARVSILTVAANGKIILSNREAERLLGRNKEELVGVEFYSFLKDELAAKIWITTHGKGGVEGTSIEFMQEVRTAEGWKPKLIEIIVLDSSKSLFAVRLLTRRAA